MLPLIDIVFLLLVFFIYAMLSMVVHRGMDVNLPGSSRAAHTEEAPLSLTVKTTPAGLALYLDTEPIGLKNLENRLRQTMDRIDRTSSPELLLFVDRSVTYQQLYQVLDRVNIAGIEKISLQAETEKP
jgi:biopolymer transport protein ExbD